MLPPTLEVGAVRVATVSLLSLVCVIWRVACPDGPFSLQRSDPFCGGLHPFIWQK